MYEKRKVVQNKKTKKRICQEIFKNPGEDFTLIKAKSILSIISLNDDSGH